MLAQKFLSRALTRFRHFRRKSESRFFFVFSRTPSFTCTREPGRTTAIVLTNLRDSTLAIEDI
jgi:hypothetical protein